MTRLNNGIESVILLLLCGPPP